MDQTKKPEIERFLEEFKLKMKTFDILFLNREKNEQALYDLEITPVQRIKYLEKLNFEDYYNGPKKDNYDKTSFDFWEFGINIKKTQVFIKISLWKNKKVLCISFHPAEHKMNFPFK